MAPNIDTKGMRAAKLTDEQFTQLREIEQRINNESGQQEEIYLLAVTRQ